VPTLAALAAIPTTQAFEVDAGDWKLSIEPRIQSWIEVAKASDRLGEDWDPFEGATPDPLDDNEPQPLHGIRGRMLNSNRLISGIFWRKRFQI
jgi:hypothetical protein